MAESPRYESDMQVTRTFRLVHGAWHGGWAWNYAELQTGHDATITAPAELTELLLKAA